MFINKYVFLLMLSIIYLRVYTFPVYICTAANSDYFDCLLNLIGSIHKVNYDSLEVVMVFDLGLNAPQKLILASIEKVKICEIEKTNPKILDFFKLPSGKQMLGWYAWKPVVIREALKRCPYVIYLDAGSTVFKPLDDLAEHVATQGYFLATTGDEYDSKHFLHNMEWATTKFVRNKFNLDSPDKRWILPQEQVMACILGASQTALPLFLQEWYDLSYDLCNFIDDGTAGGGFGAGRCDQTLLGILSYLNNLIIHKQDYKQRVPMMLTIGDKQVPFYITWHGGWINGKTNIYSSRSDLSNKESNLMAIRFK